MKCRECLQDVGEFDALIPIYQIQLSGGGVTRTESAVLNGYAHAWHFSPTEDKYHY